MGQIYKIQEETLTGIADSIRKITGKTESIKVEDISLEIETELSSPKLPTLENEGTADDLISGKELIDDDGNIVTGTFTIDNEINTQETLISQIQTALEGKTAGGGNSVEAWTGTVYGLGGLGEIPDMIVHYTDETMAHRNIVLAPRAEETITIAAGTMICTYSAWGDGTNYPWNDGVQYIGGNYSVYLPTQNNFEI